MILMPMSGIFMTNIVIRAALVCQLAITLSCGGAEEEYIPYRPDLGGNYYLQYAACGEATPYDLHDALVCEEACCIWAFSNAADIVTCEETWCCHTELCEWFFHYEECY